MTQSPKSNPAVDELRAIRQELWEIREDLHKVKEQGGKPKKKLTAQIVIGILVANFFWAILELLGRVFVQLL